MSQKIAQRPAASAADSAGRAYRTDCSGFVSTAWHLSRSLVTGEFATYNGKTVLASLHDLRPGDALLRSGHIELFARWNCSTPGTAACR
ncbi:hypothetical protein [Nonomuraea candida]|uniref:hypothetical protein n=1 Tax=Nonomuraea candida TaxID=359159 RepID=UPI0005BB3D2F|nr:hypothetical protein [Nonomuraea candida]